MSFFTLRTSEGKQMLLDGKIVEVAIDQKATNRGGVFTIHQYSCSFIEVLRPFSTQHQFIRIENTTSKPRVCQRKAALS